jgi:monoamine oxidase
VENGVFSSDEAPDPDTDRLHEIVAGLTSHMTVAEFLKQHFAGPAHDRLRRSITRMVEGYDAADPDQASVLAVREEWMNDGRSAQARVVGGYGGLIDFLAAESRKQGARIHLNAVVGAIETADGRASVRCADGTSHSADVAVLTVPVPLLQGIALPTPLRERAALAAKIGFGNVIKLLLRFKSRWWMSVKDRDFSDLLFLLSDKTVPVWWTQHPSEHPLLTGWLGGPPTRGLTRLGEGDLIEAGLASLAELFRLSPDELARDLVAARAINWANDPFARGAYSYTMLRTRAAQAELARWDGGAVLFSGEALYQGADMGTVEAALASGQATARALLSAETHD